MASPAERRTVSAAAAIQGVALVTFPAASTIFTDPKQFDLSSSAYGAMFLPQAVTAITAALLGAGLTRRVGTRSLFLVGLAANLTSMVLLLISAATEHNQAIAYPLLLAATASLGTGFGLTVPALNTFTAAFNPDRIDSAVLVLNALLGVGTALAPVFVAAFVGLGFWWGLPLCTAVLLAGLLLVAARLPLQTGPLEPARPAGQRTAIPTLFWLFAAFAVLYGICETMNGNWASLDMTKHLGSTTTQASIALTAFWASVTLGRVLFAAVQRSFPARNTYRLLPFVLAAALVAMVAGPALAGRRVAGRAVCGVLAVGAAPLVVQRLGELAVVLVTPAAGLVPGDVAVLAGRFNAGAAGVLSAAGLAPGGALSVVAEAANAIGLWVVALWGWGLARLDHDASRAGRRLPAWPFVLALSAYGVAYAAYAAIFPSYLMVVMGMP